VIVVVLATVVAVLGAVGVGAVGRAAVDRRRASTAADAAALAGAINGRPAAEAVAAANGAALVNWSMTAGPDGVTVEVRVTRGDASASARASTQP
jgi:hypothetical protein